MDRLFAWRTARRWDLRPAAAISQSSIGAVSSLLVCFLLLDSESGSSKVIFLRCTVAVRVGDALAALSSPRSLR